MQTTEALIDRIRQRAEAGLYKYGVTLDRTDLTLSAWLKHAQEEACDLCGYLERLRAYVEAHPEKVPVNIRDMIPRALAQAQAETIDIATTLEALSRLGGFYEGLADRPPCAGH